ncbi:Urb2/Npa2 family-domain-containing protein [Ampelomyces quisqualis]|uniref:Urb2/Npa2 family-domain-containing protein n=1 Tax=Ampelomyces quisqualis TaxID=50730 RepID=A0A6A5R2X7_AMPQU|nr:Urb2/Npa2 family-domain-containing protein [Ampelomyces quisqualis]
MAPISPASAKHPAPTRPRLQSVNQDFSDLNEQIRQVAHIIRLPDDWASVKDQKTSALQHVVRARAEWVLRWILDKLKDDSSTGPEARANTTIWQLLECVIHILPVSRSAPHLRDASFTTILENTLVDNYEKDLAGHEPPSTGSDSSEMLHDGTKPSRKRKRGSPGTSSPTKPTAGLADPASLFCVIKNALQSITGVATANTKTHDTTQTELMKMVLRTESAQASRILRFWLVAVQKLVARTLTYGTAAQDVNTLLDLSVVLEIWDLRIVDSADHAGSSTEDFSNECLVPTLQLAESLRHVHPPQAGVQSTKLLDITMQVLDKLVSRHLLVPSRAAFFAARHDEAEKGNPVRRGASMLSNSLGPLQAVLLQVAQMEDAGEDVPTQLASASKAIAYLLDLAIRASPSKTPKARLAERPWIQAVFISLAECVGCSLEAPPEFVISRVAVVALESALEVLQLHKITIDSTTLKDLFWYHCGVKYPESRKKEVHWSLIAALIKLDASIFVTEPRSNPNVAKEQPKDLTEFLFSLISKADFDGEGFVDAQEDSDQDMPDADSVLLKAKPAECRYLILARIVTPIISAFSKNRNLLGFMRRWDDQLVNSYKYTNRKAMREKTQPIWEDRFLTSSLMELFEQSLTQDQIAILLQDHASRVEVWGAVLAAEEPEDVKVQKLAPYKKACASAVIIPAVLQSIRSDEIVVGLKPQLHSLFVSYTERVQDDRYTSYTRLGLSWTTLCLLMAKLWPIDMHASLKLQQSLLYPLMEQAQKDVSASCKVSAGRQVDSPARAVAMLFLFDACDRLQTVPGSEERVRDSLQQVVTNLSASQLDAQEHRAMVEIFCANFVQLLSHLDPKVSPDSIYAMLKRISSLDDDVIDHVSSSLSEAILGQGSYSLHSAYSSALSEALGQGDDLRLHHVALQSLLNVQPSELSRERREAILDQLSTLLTTNPVIDIESLAAMVQLMEVPNASAKISTDGAVIFDIAAQLQKRQSMSRSVLQQLQLLCQKTLAHIIPYQSQAQSRAFLGEFQKKLNTLTQGNKKISATGLAILRAIILEQKDSQLLSVKHYIGLLKHCLMDDGADTTDVASFEDVLEAFNELSPALLGDPTQLKATTAWLRTWINENADLNAYITSIQSGSFEVAEYVARLHKLVAKYKLYPDANWLVALTTKLLRGPLDAESKRSALITITGVLTPLETADKLGLVELLTDVEDVPAQPASYSILRDLIATLPDKPSNDTALRSKQLSILPRLCTLLAQTSDAICFNALMDGIDTILNHKASLTSQHSIECVFGVLTKLTSRTSPALPAANASHIFTRLCETSRLMLLVHRNKVGGRSHILLTLLQGLLFCLFMPTSARSGALPSWLRSNTPTEPICLTPTNGAQYTRLLGTLCNPPQSSISKTHQHSRKSKDLNDPVKAARERTSHFLYPLLTSFCRFQLTGRLQPAVRTKLMPGLWEVVGTASLHREGLDAMFAGLSRSEKDVWRSVWGEYESVHGRKERFVGGEDI